MILLASDYDGTFKVSSNNHSTSGRLVLKLNRKAIESFREKGNVFVIATGRDFHSIIREIRHNKIPYDYLICDDGSTVFDNHNNNLVSHYIGEEAVCDLIEKFNDYDLNDVYLFGQKGIIKEVKNVIKFGIIRKPFVKITPIREFIYDNFPHLEFLSVGNQICIRRNQTKADALKQLVNLFGDEPNQIYTVGNGKNDLEMLKQYRGYRMVISEHELYRQDIPICTSVHCLVKKIIK